ncbi:MAG: hypothetical protein ACKON8_03620 [Planctomycetota bacterium]
MLSQSASSANCGSRFACSPKTCVTGRSSATRPDRSRDPTRLLGELEAAFPDARASRLDGLRLDWPGGWLLVRSSNTEPIVRVVAESADEAEVDQAIGRARRALG